MNHRVGRDADPSDGSENSSYISLGIKWSDLGVPRTQKTDEVALLIRQKILPDFSSSLFEPRQRFMPHFL